MSIAQPRVLQVITQLGLGGAEAVAIDILSGLRPTEVAGLFCVRSKIRDDVGTTWNDHLRTTGVAVYGGSAVPIKFGGLLQAAYRLARTLRSVRPDIVHLHTEIPELAYVLSTVIDPSNSALSVVRTIHNSTLWPRWRHVAAWTERRLTTAGVAAVSNSALAGLDELRRATGLRPIEARLSRVILNGRSVPVRARSRPCDDLIRVLFAGRFEPQKGADLLPSVLRHLGPDINSSVVLTVAGSGTLGELLRYELKRVPGLAAFAVTDPIPQLSEKLTDYDMVIVPSRFEGIGLLAIEAELAGVTVIVTRAPGLVEAVPPDHPWIAAPGDPAAFAATMAKALEQRERWSSVNAAAKAYAESRFELAAMQRAYRNLYLNVATGRLSPSDDP